ncbi:hypothetical protein [Sphingomonas sp. CARO-RG-8B-R24-01]|uniref:hypothetical protein n=1 Tax=Sphingomonas sp. CARO-RG-8B-R24-01 TaxID=2914831 RepID=UPI001F595908|nr:hypothetical protein [Sphingomonas sp. CARO-RG-8B-R24-01]
MAVLRMFRQTHRWGVVAPPRYGAGMALIRSRIVLAVLAIVAVFGCAHHNVCIALGIA